ncbi:helix-turn-helix domain-containing protein [Micromonospora sp. CPCC 206171]|uniref:helix-turn-helix domain-containing protein n=1 Tax=Micromonospora sp. CPCC 206171 TaxID=3122405 RepID=UPI002FF1DFB6
MSSTGSAHATFYRPAEVAEMLRCSEWWVKEQARRRRIPYCWIGGSYLFTEEHIREILRLFEVRPSGPSARATVRSSRRTVGKEDVPVVQLSARVPRRARRAAPDTAA